MTDREVMQQALEALENAVRYHGIMLMADPPQDAWKYHRVEDNAKQAITALREALAQPEQEPCVGKDLRCPCQDGDACHYKDCGDTKAWPVPQAEPVSCRFCHSKKGCWTWQCYHCGEIDDVQKPTPPLPVQPEQQDACFCHDGVSLQIVSGGAAPEGYLGKVTLLIDGKYVDYVKAQPAQQPVAWAVQACSKMWRGEFAEIDAKAEAKRIGGTCVAFALYTEPPQRPWVGLTEEDFVAINQSCLTKLQAAGSAESILKERNK